MYPYYNNTQIVRVNGENGAKAYNLAPNSSALLLDENQPLVWLVQTDGAGYKSISPYEIKPYEPEPTPDLNTILNRLEAIERKLNNEPDTTETKQRKQRTSADN